MEKLLENLAKKIKTKEELTSFLDEIARVKQIIFKRKGLITSEKLEGKISRDFKELLQNLEKDKENFGSREKQLAFWKELEGKLQSLPDIKLEIAFLPRESFLEKICQWLEKKVGKRIILNLIINPKIIGGAIIEYDGNWRDFSLSKEINRLLSKNGGF